MLARLFALILMPAIIACPMTCAVGVCHGENADSQSQSPSATHCCCSHCGTPDESNPNEPADPLRELPCQGVCGGVVFEKPVELNPVVVFDFPSLVAIEIPVVVRSTYQTADDDRCDIQGLGNYGRMVCALHMAFLC